MLGGIAAFFATGGNPVAGIVAGFDIPNGQAPGSELWGSFDLGSFGNPGGLQVGLGGGGGLNVGGGLAIAERAIRVHHGNVWAENGNPGLRICIELPSERRILAAVENS